MTKLDRQQAVKDYLTEVYGSRCETKDTVDFPELEAAIGRCGCCVSWENYDEWLKEKKQ